MGLLKYWGEIKLRIDNRNYDEMRKINITRDYLMHPYGSVLIEVGNTKVICTAMIEDKVPIFLRNSGMGWITSEYSMLPASTAVRKVRDSIKGKIDGRNQEIQRLIGRSLRNVVDLKKLGERTIWIDCDVIQADGGTRTASITGAYIAMVDALVKKFKNDDENFPVNDYLAAVSVGIIESGPVLDLCYEEDFKALVDMNVVMTGKCEFVEIQGTGENKSFSRNELNELLDLATKGNNEIIDLEKSIFGEINKYIGDK